MNRRSFLRSLIALGIAESTIDVDKLLWTPKTIITVPSIYRGRALTLEMMEETMNKVMNRVPILFDKDVIFYRMVEKKHIEKVSTRSMRIPLIIEPGGRL